jgi:hypothetical protein
VSTTPDVCDEVAIDDDNVAFIVSFYYDAEKNLCCEALGEVDDPEVRDAVVVGLRTVAAHLEGETLREKPNGQVH